jgi:hypothetical protein
VSNRPSAEISLSECRYADNSTPKLLDVVEIPFSHPEPRLHQTENHVIAPGRWVKTNEYSWGDLVRLEENPLSLWINNDSTAGPGLYDCVHEQAAATLNNSLVLIKPTSLIIEIGTHYFTRKKTYRASFDYGRTRYNLSVTDPVVRAKGIGTIELTDVYLCVSLAEAFEKDNRCHKVVAAVIKNPPL